MSKPAGIGFSFDKGAPVLRAVLPTHAEDAIWNAVREAIDANMTAHQFRNEAAAAWQHYLKEEAKQVAEELRGDKE